MPVGKIPVKPTRRWLVGALLVLLFILAGAFAGLGAIHGGWPWSATEDAASPIGGPFSLVAADGRTVTERSFPGKWLVVFFGYTHCADVCPTTLGEMAQALTQLGPLAGRIQPLFVTIDPDRDTPEVLRDYTAAFGDRILGLTGTPAQIAAIAKAYRVYYARSQEGKDYSMEHSAVLYVMRPDGAFAGFMPPDIAASMIAEKVKGFIDRG
jgi:protein SCO1/2